MILDSRPCYTLIRECNGPSRNLCTLKRWAKICVHSRLLLKNLSKAKLYPFPLTLQSLRSLFPRPVDNFVTQFNIPLITVQETQKFIDNLSSSKATGADEISVKVLKLVSPVFVQPLTRLINLSIQSGCFPTKWKMARVTPLFKDGAQDCRDNFRPISVLSILSKVCEKHVAASFMDYLVKTGLL